MPITNIDWRYFSDELPEPNRLLIITYLDTGAEESLEGEEPFANKTGQWFHMDIAALHDEGFGKALYVNREADRMGEREHRNIMQSGRWTYVHDLATAGLADQRFLGPEPDFILVDRDRGGVIWLQDGFGQNATPKPKLTNATFIVTWNIESNEIHGPFDSREDALDNLPNFDDGKNMGHVGIMSVPFEHVNLPR